MIYQVKMNYWKRPDGRDELLKITNTAGTKPAVYIAEGDRAGWTAYIKKRPYNKPKEVKHGRSAEKLARELINRGHKSVEIWD